MEKKANRGASLVKKPPEECGNLVGKNWKKRTQGEEGVREKKDVGRKKGNGKESKRSLVWTREIQKPWSIGEDVWGPGVKVGLVRKTGLKKRELQTNKTRVRRRIRKKKIKWLAFYSRDGLKGKS